VAPPEPVPLAPLPAAAVGDPPTTPAAGANATAEKVPADKPDRDGTRAADAKLARSPGTHASRRSSSHADAIAPEAAKSSVPVPGKATSTPSNRGNRAGKLSVDDF
jgi:hypothetical protein